MNSKLHQLLCGSGLLLLTGCSSVMTHTGASQGYYSGTRASVDMLTDKETSWAMMPFVAVDVPLSAVADTLLLPWDLYRSGQDKTQDSPKERILAEEASRPQLITNTPGASATPVP